MIAIFEDRGKQYNVAKDDVIFIDKIELNANDPIEFDKVLLYKNNEDIKIGTPYVKNVTVKGKIIKDVRDDKITVFKFKNTRNYKRTRGHKQPYTMIKIEEINA
jgi:large subunit ribosomal protein L21